MSFDEIMKYCMEQLLVAMKKSKKPKYREWVIGKEIYEEIVRHYKESFRTNCNIEEMLFCGLMVRIDISNPQAIRLMEEVI